MTDDPTDRQLTQRDLDIMGVLWERGEATVTSLREARNSSSSDASRRMSANARALLAEIGVAQEPR